MKCYSFGSNSVGQLAIKEPEDKYSPTLIESETRYNRAVGGGSHTCLYNEEEIKFAGNNTNSQQPVNITQKIRKICCGWDFTVVLYENGSIESFGISFSFKEYATDIACGVYHLLIATKDCVYGLGKAKRGGLMHHLSSNEPILLFEGPATALSAGFCHSNVVSNGRLFATGSPKFNQAKDTISWTEIELRNVVGIESGWHHSVAICEDNSIWVWGRNDAGQCGHHSNSKFSLLYQLKFDFIYKSVKVACGSEHTLLLIDKSAYSFGWNEHGNCGNGNTTNIWTPYKISLSNCFEIGSGYGHSFIFTD